MKNRYSVIMVVCFLISLVFLGANQNHQWKGTVSEVDGVMVVNNPSEPLKGKIKLDLVEIMRIDPIKYKDIDLVNFSKIFNDKNGNIYLFDADEIKAFGHKNVIFIENFEDVAPRLLEIAEPGDIILTLGAGNIWQVGEAFLKLLKDTKK